MPDVELVGGGLAEWPAGQGPRGESLAAAAFVDASGHDDLLALPHQFHEAGIGGWRCEGVWQVEPLALVIAVRAPVDVAFRLPFHPARHAALIDAILRDGAVYICPTTPRLGLNARLARDQSFFCAVDQTFGAQWRAMKGRA